MKLNHPGIYRIIGENYELLANIVGEVPCLRITSALLMNDLVQKVSLQYYLRTQLKYKMYVIIQMHSCSSSMNTQKYAHYHLIGNLFVVQKCQISVMI